MSWTGFHAVAVKELGDLLRDRRLPVFLIVVTLLLTVPMALFGNEFLQGYNGAPRFGDVLMPTVFFGPVVLVVLSLTVAADAVSRERDGGTLALLGSSPLTHLDIYLGKLASALVAYLGLALAVLAFHLAFVPALGWPIVEALAWLLLVPFLSLYVFLVGVAFLVGSSLSSSKGAIGAALAVDLGLFFLQREPPGLGFLVQSRVPDLWALLAYLPFDMVYSTGQVAVHGAAYGWTPVVTSLVAGLVLLVMGYVVLTRKEVGA